MHKQELVSALRRELEGLAQRRRDALRDSASRAARLALQQFQSARMSATHATCWRRRNRLPPPGFS